MSREEVAAIPGPGGPLPAILHFPDRPVQPSSCVIMLSSGLLGRAGPQRLYVNAARQWAARGFLCLRVDLSGVGENLAELAERHFDNHRPEDARAAVTYAREVLQADVIYLQGLCAGARVALKCAAQDARVAGVVAWSCPVLSSSESMPPSPYEDRGALTDWKARSTLASVVQALTRLRFVRPSWWRSRLRHGGRETRRLLRAIEHVARGTAASGNPFLDAVDRLQRSGRGFLFLFGERDAMPLGEFRDRFPAVAQGIEPLQGYGVVASATHTFNAADSQREVIDLSAQWMLRHMSQAPTH
jgi:alpha/beta superfamily hydrolase